MKTKLDRKTFKILIGFLLLCFGILFSVTTEGWTANLLTNIENSILLKDSGKLVILSIFYTLQYGFYYFFLFISTLLIIDGVMVKNTLLPSIGYIVSLLLIIIMLNFIHHDNFSFISYFLTLSILFFIQVFIPKQKNYYVIYSIILFFVLIAVGWMQLVPVLSVFGIGTGDLATSLKLADEHLTGSYLLNTLATIFMLVFFAISITLTYLVHLLNKQILTMEKIQEHESELKATRIALVESKMHEEINSLVHDLKTPLSTLEGLSSLIKMRMRPNDEAYLTNYLNRMGDSIQKMNDMISEILYEDTKQPISPKELVEYVTSHLILAEKDIEIVVKIEENIPYIRVNKIRFSRALSNILENAIASLQKKAGIIKVNVKRKDKHIIFEILDNGSGIESKHMEAIWADGFSTKNSSGKGLSFVKKVVENHQGTIQVNSVPGSHTQMNIILPIYKEGEDKDEYYDISGG